MRVKNLPHTVGAMASTRLNEAGWEGDVIERQLAHVEGNSTRAVYNHAEYLARRREMMQAWADSLDQIRVYQSSLRSIQTVVI